jgi:hypothetical protein
MLAELKDLMEKGLFSRVCGFPKTFFSSEFDVKRTDGSKTNHEETARVRDGAGSAGCQKERFSAVRSVRDGLGTAEAEACGEDQ